MDRSRTIFKTIYMCPYCGDSNIDVYWDEDPGGNRFIDEFKCNECGLEDYRSEIMSITIYYDGHKYFDPGETDKEYKLLGID